MVNRLVITLEQSEYSALLDIAVKELRDPSDQVRAILRSELERRGLWSPSSEVCESTIDLAEAEEQT